MEAKIAYSAILATDKRMAFFFKSDKEKRTLKALLAMGSDRYVFTKDPLPFRAVPDIVPDIVRRVTLGMYLGYFAGNPGFLIFQPSPLRHRPLLVKIPPPISQKRK